MDICLIGMIFNHCIGNTLLKIVLEVNIVIAIFNILFLHCVKHARILLHSVAKDRRYPYLMAI